jgi:serine/threonine-protein kinase
MISKYALGATIAKSTFASVLRGTDPAGRAVAIKVIPRACVNATALPAFRKSFEALAKEPHPAIATPLELIENERAVCLVSELCEGQALSSLLREGARPELKNAWDVARPLLEALAFAHAKGALHRDLKPSNLIVSAGGRVRVTDFGVSLLLAGRTEVVHYRAPEQFDQQACTVRTDLYQAGAIVYHLVTGRVPFDGAPEVIAHRVLQERPSDPSSYDRRIAWQLDWMIQKALGKDPQERFGTIAEFAEGLRVGLQDSTGGALAALGSRPAKAAAPPAARLVQKARALAPAPPAPKPSNAVTAAAKPRVLFVDDEERILNALVALFRDRCEVKVATGGEEALRILGQWPAHVLVTDQRMPGMTGVELLRKARERAPNTVRILLTGYTDLAALVGSINDGEIFRFASKPWDNDELRKAVSDAAKVAQELASSAPPRTASPRLAGSLLVIDRTQGLGKGLERLLAGEARVLQAATPAQAAEVLKNQEVAAIVADLGAGMDGLVALFRQVKAQRPEILSILLADQPDSELGIELVNKAHVFRFLPKPVNARELRAHVADALRRFASLRPVPTLQDAAPAASRNPSVRSPA